MTSDLDLPVRVIGMPIVRESDGLAMSSRNAYLSKDEREKALALSRAIYKVRDLYNSGERTIDVLCVTARSMIEPFVSSIDYLEFRNGVTLEPANGAVDGTLLALAVKIGKTRLIDNTLLGEEL
jgi:pantoate--beta-alanine ligase